MAEAEAIARALADPRSSRRCSQTARRAGAIDGRRDVAAALADEALSCAKRGRGSVG